MSRDISPKCKACRKFGMKMCSKPPGKCAFEKKRGNRNTFFTRRLSDHGAQLKEKQKARVTYGIQERQFRRYMNIAGRSEGITGDKLIQILESRLDNVAYRLGFGESRHQIRQWINHGHITVNEKKVDIPSYQIKPGDKIAFNESSRKKTFFDTVTQAMGSRTVPDWLQSDNSDISGIVLKMPEVTGIDMGINTRLIVEYYSRR